MTNQVAPTYASSQLKQILKKILIEIERIKAKYPEDLGQGSDLNVMTAITNVINGLENKVIKAFDERKKPGLMKIIPIISLFLALKNKELPLIQAFSIDHPMLLELALSLHQMVTEMPSSLEELMPFFNPESLNKDLHNINPLSKEVVTAAFKCTLVLKSIPNDETNEPTFNYKLTKYIQGETYETTNNGNSLYQDELNGIETRLANDIQNYMSAHADEPCVKNQVAKAKLLKAAVNTEIDAIRSLVHPVFSLIEQIEIHLNSLDINGIDEQIIKSNHCITQIDEVTATLKNKALAYSTQTINQLINTNATLVNQQKNYQENGLDMAFCNDKLPKYAFGTIERLNVPPQVEKFAIEAKLQETVERHLESLKTMKNSLTKNITELSTLKQCKIAGWQQQTIQMFAKQMEEEVTSLTTLQKELVLIQTQATQNLPTNTTEELALAIEAKKQININLQQLHDKVNTKIVAISAAAKLAPQYSSWDDSNCVQETQTAQSLVVIEQYQAFLKSIQSTQAEQNKGTRELEAKLEKAKDAAEFEKQMKAANTAEIEKLLLTQTTQLQQVKDKQDALQHKHQSDSATITTQEEKLKTQSSTLKQQQFVMQSALSESKKLLEPLWQFAKINHTLFPAIEELDTLFAEKGKVQKFLRQTQPVIAQKRKEYTDGISLLEEVQKLLSPLKDKSKIPFEEIEKLAILQKMGINHQGFEFFLAFIGLEEAKQEWNELRARQKSKLQRRAPASSYKEKHELLEKQISIKLEQLKALIAALPGENDIDSTLQTYEQVQANFESIESQHAQNKETLDKLKQEQQKDKTELEALLKEEESLRTNQQFFGGLINIINNIKAHQQKIEDAFAADDNTSLTDEKLYQTIASLNQQYKNLLIEKDKLFNIGTDAHQNNAIIVDQLIKGTYDHLQKNIGLKINLNTLQDKHADFSAGLETIEVKTASNTTDPKRLTEWLTQYNEYADMMIKHQKGISQIQNSLHEIGVNSLNDGIQKITDDFAKIQAKAETIGTNLLDQITAIIEHNNPKVFADNKKQESQESHDQNAQKIQVIHQTLEKLPSDEELIKAQLTDSLKEKIGNLKQIKATALQQLQQSQAANQQLQERINARQTVVEDLLLPQLTQYNAKLSSGIHKISLQKNKHTLYENIDAMLKSYMKSGNSEELLSYIKQNKRKFPDINSQALLCKIIAEVKDLDQQIPANYNLELPKHSATELHKQAKDILEKKTNKQYVNAINHLQGLIDTMETGWPQTESLAKKLRANLDTFVTQFPEPSPDNYEQFKEHFIARLHSEDDLMCKHRAAWKANLANFAIGVVTLGIALGIKLAISKHSEGRFTLFFDKTKRQQKISAIEEVVIDELKRPIAGS